jgi:hypothetical protein
MAPAHGSTDNASAKPFPASAESWNVNRTGVCAIYSRAWPSYPPAKGTIEQRGGIEAPAVPATQRWLHGCAGPSRALGHAGRGQALPLD